MGLGSLQCSIHWEERQEEKQPLNTEKLFVFFSVQNVIADQTP